MRTIIPEELEELNSLVSISAVREWCIGKSKKAKNYGKNEQKHCNRVAVNFSRFICMVKTYEKLEPFLLLVFFVGVEKVFSLSSWAI